MKGVVIVGTVKEIMNKYSVRDREHYKNVFVKNLKEGHIYVADERLVGTANEGWRNTWLYLGRNVETKDFIYVFIGAPSFLTTEQKIYEQINLYIYSLKEQAFSVTKSNKKVYTPVLNDWLNRFEFNINSPFLAPETRDEILEILGLR